jgi:YbbR domain-containing protein
VLKIAKNIIIRTKFRRIKRLIKSKAFVGSLLFAVALWIYTSLNSEYTPFVKVPLSVILPSDKAIESNLPSSISLKVRGGGWQLFYLIFFNSTKQCVVDLSDKTINEKEYIITRMDFLKGIENIVDVEPIDVLPESVKLILGRMVTKKVPVNPILSIKPKDGFIAMADFKISPDSIKVTGNEKNLQKLKYWNTKKVYIDNIFRSETIPVPLSDSLSSILKLSHNYVNVSIEVQQSADKTIYDIPVTVKGGALPKNSRIFPQIVSVVIHGGVEQIASISKYDIDSYVEYKDIISDSTGILKPKIEIPDKVSNYFVHPRYIYHYKNIKSLKN